MRKKIFVRVVMGALLLLLAACAAKSNPAAYRALDTLRLYWRTKRNSLFVLTVGCPLTKTRKNYWKMFSFVGITAAPLLKPNGEAPVLRANDFAFSLSAALSKDVDGENFVCSPFSAWLPLAALVNGTDDAHKGQLLDALGAAGLSE